MEIKEKKSIKAIRIIIKIVNNIPESDIYSRNMKTFKKKKQTNSFKVNPNNSGTNMDLDKKTKIRKQNSELENSKSQTKIKQIKTKNIEAPFKTKK